MNARNLLAPVLTLGRSLFPAVTTVVQTETLAQHCNYVKIFAPSNSVYIKFGGTDPSSANFDDIIPAGMAEYLAVPMDTRIMKILPVSATATDIYVVEK